jgi:glycosyltransferase involved in cell wall biosynthesis
LIQLEKKLKVSVCVITYNQEKYIRQCLQSIVDQKTDFEFEVIVGDDCSTDGTRAIVQEFSDRYPEVVKPKFHKKNGGGTKNYFSVHEQAKADYIAHCDGDDYWLPNKLSYQVALLDTMPNIIFFADYIGRKKLKNDEIIKLDSAKLFYENNPVLHSSKIYRRTNFFSKYENREYFDFEISLRQLGVSGICGLTNTRTVIYTANANSSVRRFANIKLLNAYINMLNFARLIGIGVFEVNRSYNYYVKSLIKLAIFTNDISGVKNISKVVVNSNFYLKFSARIYLLLARYYVTSTVFRNLLVIKRKIISHLR